VIAPATYREENRMDRMAGKTVIVTGAASGLGESTARMMAAEGAVVFLADIDDARGRRIADEIGGAAEFVHCDVALEPDVAALVDRMIERHGRLDCMVNNAGIVGAMGPIDEIPLAEYEFTMAVLLRSVFLGSKHAARVMKPRHSGVILSTTSVAGVLGGLGAHVYATAKGAVIALTRNLAAELGAHSIRVNAIAPGKHVTPMNAYQIVGDPDDLAATREAFRTRTPILGRIGLAEDIAHAALWLASDDAGFVSGHVLVVDGGLTSGSRENVLPGEQGRWAVRQELIRTRARGLPEAGA
jgi:NAD(P)-dependent dehydrogenase (short-subunit alcohol dehydrogenase family)